MWNNSIAAEKISAMSDIGMGRAANDLIKAGHDIVLSATGLGSLSSPGSSGPDDKIKILASEYLRLKTLAGPATYGTIHVFGDIVTLPLQEHARLVKKAKAVEEERAQSGGGGLGQSAAPSNETSIDDGKLVQYSDSLKKPPRIEPDPPAAAPHHLPSNVSSAPAPLAALSGPSLAVRGASHPLEAKSGGEGMGVRQGEDGGSGALVFIVKN